MPVTIFKIYAGRRRVKSKVVEYEYEYDEPKNEPRLSVGEGATVDEAGVTTCSCGRSYTKRKNYIRYYVHSVKNCIHFLYIVAFLDQAYHI